MNDPGGRNEVDSIMRGGAGGSDVGDEIGGSGATVRVGDFSARDGVECFARGATDGAGSERSRIGSFSAVVVEVDVAGPL